MVRFRVLKFTVLMSTYDPQTIEALRVIRYVAGISTITSILRWELLTKISRDSQILEGLEKEARNRLHEYEKQLRTYASIGGEFETIAQTYLEVLRGIDTAKDDLKRMTE